MSTKQVKKRLNIQKIEQKITLNRDWKEKNSEKSNIFQKLGKK